MESSTKSSTNSQIKLKFKYLINMFQTKLNQTFSTINSKLTAWNKIKSKVPEKLARLELCDSCTDLYFFSSQNSQSVGKCRRWTEGSRIPPAPSTRPGGPGPSLSMERCWGVGPAHKSVLKVTQKSQSDLRVLRFSVLSVQRCSLPALDAGLADKSVRTEVF